MGRVHVVEMSSYQNRPGAILDPSVGISAQCQRGPIDRHGTLDNYAAVKARLVAGVQPHGTSIVGVDDGWCRNIADRLDRAGKRVVRISVNTRCPTASMSSAKPSCRLMEARAPRSRDWAASVRCAGCTMRRTRPAPPRARSPWASRPKFCKTACAAFPASRIAWSRSAAAAMCCSSMIPRAPMRDAAAHALSSFAISSGSPAVSRSKAASRVSPNIFRGSERPI